MRKYFLSLDECEKGMRIAENLYNEYGAVIIVEGTVLDDYIIDRIKNMGIEKIKVFVSYKDDIIYASGTELFKAQYKDNVNAIKNILHDISDGKPIDTKRIDQASDSIIFRINENRDIVNCINEMRDADQYLYTHSVNVALLSMLIGKWLKFDYYKIKALVNSALLHDIGKSKISAEILNKPGPLDESEFNEMRKHSAYGFKIAENIQNISDGELKGILLHHEREDGSGYPFGLRGSSIHVFAKIIAVADVYDAMTSNRCYKEKESPFEVIEYMEKQCFNVLDYKIVNLFLKNIASYYIGDFIKLSTGSIGEIVHINPYNVSRPIVRADDNFIDLATEKKIKILEIINC